MNRKQRRAQGQGPKKPRQRVDPAALYDAGIQAYRVGELAKAADLIGQAIASSGPLPELHYNLAIVLKAMGRLPEAAVQYEQAIALKPDHVNAHNNLGNVWKALGHTDKARASFAQALHHHPSNADTHYSLGILACDLGELSEAERHLRRCLECDPNDARGARILLAHLGAATAPERTPAAHLLSLYETRSRSWDQERTYFAPALVAEAFRRHASSAPPENRLDVLDIGCGTGLVGALVRGEAGQLDGVDLSPAMLEKARAKGIYDGLFEADLAPFMASRQGRYDAVLAAAALIHFGDLMPLFQSATGCQRGQGLFVFTLFSAAAGIDHAVAATTRLAQSGCFRHSAAYVERLASDTGFSVLELESVIHEHDQDGKPVAGLLAVLARKP
jgi:predicted TPR repeat methyltransferase